MANVLTKICDDKALEVEELKQQYPSSLFAELKPSQKSFYDALAAPKTSYIFECKKASPSKGLIRENFDLDEITSAYSKEASCFSVLTDEKYFQGKHQYLQYVANKVSQPVLNKDFFIDPFQVHLARYLGADAILLMLSVLNDEQYKALAELSYQCNMDVLTEVSNQEETERALNLGATIIGINNRNLRDLSTDLANTEALVPIIKNDPRFEGVIISESGIYTNADIQRLSPLVDGFLVGSALMAQTDLHLAIKQLAYGKVKICGIRSAEQASMVSEFPVSYLGLIFAPNSPRFVSIETALEIVKAVEQHYVGVFVDAPLEQVVEYAGKLSLSAVQLHGHESDDYIVSLRQSLPQDVEIWKALAIRKDENAKAKSDVEALSKLVALNKLSRILLDCKVGDQAGGTGQQFDWSVLESLSNKQTLVLAGGIGANNVQEANATGVGIIDANSLLESAPGIKSSALITQFFEQLRS